MTSDIFLMAFINGVLIGGVYSLTAIGLTLIFGVMGIGNFAHGAFLMAGMYIAFWLFTLLGIDPYLGILLVMAFLFVLGWYMQKFLLNKIMGSAHYNTILLTIGVGIFMENLALFLWPDFRQLQVSYGNAGISLGTGLQINLVRFVAFLIAVGLSVSLYCFLKLTDTGKAIRAASQNKIGAQVVGINIWKIYMLTFAIGAALSGAAGAAITPYFPIYYNVGDMFVLVAFVVVCLGGMGNLLGAMIAGLMIGVGESLGTLIISGGQKQIITFCIFIVFLLFRPQGMFRSGGYWEAQ